VDFLETLRMLQMNANHALLLTYWSDSNYTTQIKRCEPKTSVIKQSSKKENNSNPKLSVLHECQGRVAALRARSLRMIIARAKSSARIVNNFENMPYTNLELIPFTQVISFFILMFVLDLLAARQTFPREHGCPRRNREWL